MSRKSRIFSSTGIYHIILRSVNQHIIFEEEADYLKFLYLLTDCKEKYGIDIYAYCLMKSEKNAGHFLTDEKAMEIFKAVTKLDSTYDVESLDKKQRNDYVKKLKKERLTVKQIARVMDISLATVNRICKNDT